MRMVEHIVALRTGMDLDNVVIRLDSGDPPLFDRGSMDLVEAVEASGIRKLTDPPTLLTVREPVTVAGPNGRFLTFRPCPPDRPVLNLDCAVDFRSAIGRQRIRVTVTRDIFRYGALARTNCTFAMLLYVRTIGKLFADTRNLGYSTRTILVAGRRRYFNTPQLLHNGKSLEAVWHRAMLDLLAAIALIDAGRFVGEVISYKAGHALDVLMIRKLCENRLLREL
jgi:UDP-3-O-acyl-N-acetylglucosamine deacetylase